MFTDAIKANLIPPELTPEQIGFTYANEADMLNVALFGKSYNAILIEQGKSTSERLVVLHDLAVKQLRTMRNLNLSTLPQSEI